MIVTHSISIRVWHSFIVFIKSYLARYTSLNIFYLHFIWFVIFGCFRILSILRTFFLTYFSYAIHFSINLFTFWSLQIRVSFLIDWMSMSFIRVVLTISTIIIVYSYNYIAPYSKSIYFLWLTVIFVIRMLFVVSMSNLFFAMLGWDGLGLISFFLIVYYQNQSSIVSGSFTLLINRLGDRFFLVTLVLIFYGYSDFTYFSSNLGNALLIIFIVITFITKRALYPFSPWLPMAIAAPTPISALVHSSTLVTAGLYLIIRFSYLLYSCPEMIKLLTFIAIFTSFYAGMNTIFEIDLKKLIALSTLRHLGFIAIAFSAGLLHLRFFHLLVHALFKSLLFITIGDIIININHRQDIRYLSKGSIYTPFSSTVIRVSIINLLGIPNIRGYFSKDLVLESMNFRNLSVFVMFILYINVLFTYYYSYKLLFFRFQSVKLNSFQLFHNPYLIHSFLMLFLSISTLFFSTIFINFLFSYMIFYFMMPVIKFLPLILNTLVFVYLLIVLSLPRVKIKSVFSFFSSIMFLSNIMMRFSSTLYIKYLFNSVKRLEIGFINYSFNTLPRHYFNSLSSFIYRTLYRIRYRSIMSFFILFFFILLSRSI